MLLTCYDILFHSSVIVIDAAKLLVFECVCVCVGGRWGQEDHFSSVNKKCLSQTL